MAWDGPVHVTIRVKDLVVMSLQSSECMRWLNILVSLVTDYTYHEEAKLKYNELKTSKIR